MKARGFGDVYQLDGGIARYGETFGDDGLWEGSMFVFDDRMTVDFSDHTEGDGAVLRMRRAHQPHRELSRPPRPGTARRVPRVCAPRACVHSRRGARVFVSRRRDRPAIPVIVVAGFLGAGKTTLLNALLGNTVGARLGVIVNDFGAINVDALLVAGQSAGTISFGNGCLCCSVDADGLGDALQRARRPGRRTGRDRRRASGIAEPRALIKMVVAVADPAIRYGGLVYVLDAAAATLTRQLHPEIGGHLAIADLVVINKADLVDGDVLSGVLDMARELNPTAPAWSPRRATSTRALFDRGRGRNLPTTCRGNSPSTNCCARRIWRRRI